MLHRYCFITSLPATVFLDAPASRPWEAVIPCTVLAQGRCTLLLTGDVSTKNRVALEERARRNNLELLFLQDIEMQAVWLTVPATLRLSLRVYTLLKTCDFDRIICGCAGAALFHCIQAGRTLEEWKDIVFIVNMDTSTELTLEDEGRWNSDGVDGIVLMWSERYCVEHCNALVCDRVMREKLADWILPECIHNALEGAVLATVDIKREEGPTLQEPPLISVCIAHYNHGQYLPAALDSLAAQTWHNFECVVMDDGSTDLKSLNIFQQCRKRMDDRFHFFEKENEGPSITRNACVAKANGTFLIFFDADNLAKPHMLETLYAALMRSKTDVVLSHSMAFDANLTDPAPKYLAAPVGAELASSLFVNVIGDIAFCMKKDVFLKLKGFAQTRHGCEDWAFLVRSALAGYTQEIIPEPLYWYRHTTDGMRSTMSLYHSHKQVLNAYTPFLPEYARRAVEHLLVPQRYVTLENMTVIIRSMHRLGIMLEKIYTACFPFRSRRQRFMTTTWNTVSRIRK